MSQDARLGLFAELRNKGAPRNKGRGDRVASPSTRHLQAAAEGSPGPPPGRALPGPTPGPPLPPPPPPPQRGRAAVPPFRVGVSPLRAGPRRGGSGGSGGNSPRPARLPPGPWAGLPAGRGRPGHLPLSVPPPPPPRLPTSAPAPLRLRRCPSAAGAATRPPSFPPSLSPAPAGPPSAPSPAPPLPQDGGDRGRAGRAGECRFATPSPGLRDGQGDAAGGVRAGQDPRGRDRRGGRREGPRLPLPQRSPFYLQKIEDGHLNNSLGSPVQADVYFPRLVNHLYSDFSFFIYFILFGSGFFF